MQYESHVDKRLRSDTFTVDDDPRTQREYEVSRVRHLLCIGSAPPAGIEA